jgi:hypothetical protein
MNDDPFNQLSNGTNTDINLPVTASYESLETFKSLGKVQEKSPSAIAVLESKLDGKIESVTRAITQI